MDVVTFPENLQTTSGLSILYHDVISFLDATSYDKYRLLYSPGVPLGHIGTGVAIPA